MHPDDFAAVGLELDNWKEVRRQKERKE